MTQNYNLSCKQTTTSTKIISWAIFRRTQKSSIQFYILNLLLSFDTGLTCREISQVSGIEVQSLTNPLKSLVDADKIKIIGIKTSSVSNRKVQVYGI